ncbi:hypothetical protein RND71_027412 [Anisodus tanguticus]|uniref:Uncharacterized protein n=1 Tax=Anisodus tanguticus TaxID=243964 RepID=A0AAE1V826_9SOLA|nr:hypothetical protein RND71_027412 [Anisodus tanguticus]
MGWVGGWVSQESCVLRSVIGDGKTVGESFFTTESSRVRLGVKLKETETRETEICEMEKAATDYCY